MVLTHIILFRFLAGASEATTGGRDLNQPMLLRTPGRLIN